MNLGIIVTMILDLAESRKLLIKPRKDEGMLKLHFVYTWATTLLGERERAHLVVQLDLATHFFRLKSRLYTYIWRTSLIHLYRKSYTPDKLYRFVVFVVFVVLATVTQEVLQSRCRKYIVLLLLTSCSHRSNLSVL